MANLTKVDIQRFAGELNYRHVTTAASVFLVGGAIFYHIVEKFNWLDAFYFTFVTLATIGYGDFVPKTPAGKIFTMFYALFGITIFIILAKLVLTSVAVKAVNHRKKTKD